VTQNYYDSIKTFTHPLFLDNVHTKTNKTPCRAVVNV